MNAGGVDKACKSNEPMLRIGSTKSEYRNPKQYQNTNDQNSKLICFERLNFKNLNLFRVSDLEFRISIAKQWLVANGLVMRR